MTSADELTERLREIAARLRDPELPAGEAEALAREAADLVGRAGSQIEAALREARTEEGR
jgi:hypothetical protein